MAYTPIDKAILSLLLIIDNIYAALYSEEYKPYLFGKLGPRPPLHLSNKGLPPIRHLNDETFNNVALLAVCLLAHLSGEIKSISHSLPG